MAWKEAADVMGLSLKQSCPKGYEIPGVQVEYEFNNAGHDYIEICFCTDGHIELYHNYENPDMDIEYEENATSIDVQEIADKFQEIISKINIYS